MTRRFRVYGGNVGKFVSGSEGIGHSCGFELVVLRIGLLNIMRPQVVRLDVLVPHDVALGNGLDECRIRKVVLVD